MKVDTDMFPDFSDKWTIEIAYKFDTGDIPRWRLPCISEIRCDMRESEGSNTKEIWTIIGNLEKAPYY